MNTIPLTHDANKPTYTVLGGLHQRNCKDKFPVSVLVLNRGPRLYRASLFQDLTHIGFDSIISIELPPESAEIESLAGRFPHVRFIMFKQELTIGDYINVGMREACTPFVFVIWNDMKLATSTLSSRFFDKVGELDMACLVPCLADAGNNSLPTNINPAVSRRVIKTVALIPKKDHEKTLYPFDWCGIYHREKFIRLGGFDFTIRQPCWQRLDFGLRAWLWGESICHVQALKLLYTGSSPVEDTTVSVDYGRVWLKNIAPQYRVDMAHLPASRFLMYLLQSGLGPLQSWRFFRAARRWVDTNAYRFKQDITRLVDLWDPVTPDE
ncbi:MAG: hypothetical protein A2087_10475 [Spirochaetes bacterium GWD1_61_31]|nr:MAG: hypothetical protein A2Y37_12040 [Spirochaetes bacterium GWB1_60_80]OHD30111.1 MAG: hypothetical protein A2004_13900 [Spirochaetes bacterium GWC1_61_12]OHD34638.1 MAG: hypothetical protein A2087_10475 [Spirochaetes bacterium GWD1_61_31]OHD46454.1 MAG: hypothetical protein A2Y35_10380 [Spirochaetes bacterium GWE1_60_18]OHD59509.1 MAG: hypothetical protein A2Y32_10335 [Spirochaetes bacterium GWF1_60_12]HAW85794.1 hypothetical protein [Spirochaetaceae bacterium]